MLTPTDYPADSPVVEDIQAMTEGPTTLAQGTDMPDVRDAADADSPRLDHLRALEAESIHIMREVVAEFERPVMLYSIGKDSSVLLRLAQKAFYPGPIPFPLLHVDTTYKFREMIEFRDRYAAADRRAADRPHQSGSHRRRHAAVRRRHAALLRPAQDASRCSTRSRPAASTRRSAARAATRSARAPRSASSRCATPRASGIRSTSGRSSGTC